MSEMRHSQTTITLTPAQTAMVDHFQAQENLPSRAVALQLLLDVALETVTSRGRRFWDKTIVKAEE